MIERVVASFALAGGLEDCKVLVVADGVKSPTADGMWAFSIQILISCYAEFMFTDILHESDPETSKNHFAGSYAPKRGKVSAEVHRNYRKYIDALRVLCGSDRPYWVNAEVGPVISNFDYT